MQYHYPNYGSSSTSSFARSPLRNYSSLQPRPNSDRIAQGAYSPLPYSSVHPIRVSPPPHQRIPTTTDKLRELRRIVAEEKKSLRLFKNQLDKTLESATAGSARTSTSSLRQRYHHHHRPVSAAVMPHDYSPHAFPGSRSLDAAMFEDRVVKAARWKLSGIVQVEILMCEDLPRDGNKEPDTYIEGRIIKVPPAVDQVNFDLEEQTVKNEQTQNSITEKTSTVFGNSSPSFTNVATNTLTLRVDDLDPYRTALVMTVVDTGSSSGSVKYLGSVTIPMNVVADPHALVRLPTGLKLSEAIVSQRPDAPQIPTSLPREIQRAYLHADVRYVAHPRKVGINRNQQSQIEQQKKKSDSLVFSSRVSEFESNYGGSSPFRKSVGGHRKVYLESKGSDTKDLWAFTSNKSNFSDPKTHHFHCVKCGETPGNAPAVCVSSLGEECSVCKTLSSRDVDQAFDPETNPKSPSKSPQSQNQTEGESRNQNSASSSTGDDDVAHVMRVEIKESKWFPSKPSRNCIMELRIMKKPSEQQMEVLEDDAKRRNHVEHVHTMKGSVVRSPLQNGNGHAKWQFSTTLKIYKSEVARLKVKSAGQLYFVAKLIEFDILGNDVLMGDTGITLSALTKSREQQLPFHRPNHFWRGLHPLDEFWCRIILESIR